MSSTITLSGADKAIDAGRAKARTDLSSGSQAFPSENWRWIHA